MAQVAVRDFLNQIGLDNSKIGWDNKTNSVLYDGKSILKPANVQSGRSFASVDDIMKGLTGAGVNTDLVGVRDYLGGQGIYNVGWNQGSGGVTANGQEFLKPAFVQNGRSYADRSAVDQALQNAGINAPVQQQNDLLRQLVERTSQPFAYNPETDPAYQAAVKQAQSGAKLASRGAMEDLNARGILNSSITADNVAQIQQDAMGRVNAEILPQLMSQAYAREQQQTGNLFNLFGAYSDIDQRNYQRWADGEARKIQQDQIRIANEQRSLENAWNRTVSLGYVDNEASKVLGIPAGTPTFQAKNAADERKARLQEQANDNAYKRANLGLQQDQINLDREKFGISQEKDMAKAKAGALQDANKFFDGLRDDLTQEDITDVKTRFKRAYDYYSNQPNGYQLFQQDKANIAKNVPANLQGYLVNQLETTLSTMGK